MSKRAEISLSANSQAAYRNNTPDALFGSILTIEAAVGVLLGEVARVKEGSTSDAFILLRKQVEQALSRGTQTTKYGTGAMEINDGERDSLDAIFSRAGEVIRRATE